MPVTRARRVSIHGNPIAAVRVPALEWANGGSHLFAGSPATVVFDEMLARALASLTTRRHERAGFALYTASVGAARDPLYFVRLSVPDTLDGRFDLIGLFAALLIRRLSILPPRGPALAQAVFDAMFADMDFSLREIGVGEMSVGRKMRAMWEAFHGRAKAYEAPLVEQDAEALANALARNVWRGDAPPGAASSLARAALAQDHHLAGQSLDMLLRGKVDFLPAEQVLAGTAA